MSKFLLPEAFLNCPVCGCEGIASTGMLCLRCGDDHTRDEGDPPTRCAGDVEPVWSEDDGGPCVSCGIALRVVVDDARAYCEEAAE